MDPIDYQKDLNRIFAEYATFFDLPLKTSAESGDDYTRLPRSIFANLMLKEAKILELLNKGTLSLKELREDCQALRDIAEGDFKGMERPSVSLKVAAIPGNRWYLYLPEGKAPAEEMPPSDIEFAKDPGPDVWTGPERRKPHKPMVYLWLLAGVVAALVIGILVQTAPGVFKAPPPTPTPVVATATPTATETATPTMTDTPTPTPRPKPKPKPKPKPTAVPTPLAIPTLEGGDDSVYTEEDEKKYKPTEGQPAQEKPTEDGSISVEP